MQGLDGFKNGSVNFKKYIDIFFGRFTKSVRFREKSRISRNPRQGPKFCKLQDAIRVTVISEIFKFLQNLNPFGQENFLHELSSGYPN